MKTHLMSLFNISSLIICSILLVGCTSEENHQKVNIHRKQMKIEPIVRLSDEKIFIMNTLIQKERKAYFFEPSKIAKITKDHFRCRGSAEHPPIIQEEQGTEGKTIEDCRGIDAHSLPIQSGEEFVFPILLTLLNNIQQTLGEKVVITSGHCCPKHALYLHPSKPGLKSYSMMGAAVDFYVQGFEKRPEAVIDCIINQYKGDEPLYEKFVKASKDVITWSNHEILIKLIPKEQGRDLDHAHLYPYISIEVKYDREKKKNIEPTWKLTHESYYKW